ncbi:MAG TPA: porin [Ramlibacter sp.]|nr:porin [Ramlibacter sp.]
MKRHLISAAVLVAASSGAFAQSSVTIFGTVDATVQHGSGSVSSVNRLGTGNLSSGKLGFRGVEALGGGLKAGFWLEGSVLTDSGVGGGSNTNNQASGTSAAVGGGQGLTFARRSTVSIGGDWGELRLGRDYTPVFVNQPLYDPFGNVGVGNSLTQNSSLGGLTSVRASNSVAYLYGHSFNGTQVGTSGPNFLAMYYMGENASNAPAGTAKDGRGYSLRAGYIAGALDVGVAASSTKYAAGDVGQFNVGGSYDFRVAKAMALYARDRVSRGATGAAYLVGAVVPKGSGEVHLAYSRYKTDAAGSPASAKFALGYVHNLSKRTALYATVARVGNSGPVAQALNGSVTAAGQSSSGYDLGMRHNF